MKIQRLVMGMNMYLLRTAWLFVCHSMLYLVAKGWMNNALTQYSLLCGPQFCNNTLFSTLPLIRNNNLCSDCSCHDNCIFEGSCCPDKYFTLALECQSTTIQSHTSKFDDVEDSFIMVTSCPNDSQQDIKTKCEELKLPTEMLKYRPVTSILTNIAYKNEYCAKCRNETEYKTWHFIAECKRHSRFNLMSSYDEILQHAAKQKCRVSTYSTNPFIRGCGATYSHTIAKCNVSGTWVQYDYETEYGCNHYDLYDKRFPVFKNVFCFMCNPPKVMKQIVALCNYTKRWDIYSSEIEMACLKGEQSVGTYPFKNVYCYLCNIPSKIRTVDRYGGRKNIHFFDAEGTVTETKGEKYNFEYYFTDFQMFNLSIPTPRSVVTIQEPDPLTEQNKLNLYERYYAMTGDTHFCGNYSFLKKANDSFLDRHDNHVRAFCDCSDTCHFNEYFPCCIDKEFERSTTCIKSKSGRYIAYNGCEDIREDNILHQLCRTPYLHFGSFLPFYDRTTSADYKNVFCGLCRYQKKNHGNFSMSQITTNIPNFSPWDFIIKCNKTLSLHFNLHLVDLFEESLNSNCLIEYEQKIQGCMSKRTCPDQNICTDHGSPYTVPWACRTFKSSVSSMNYYSKLSIHDMNYRDNIFCLDCKFANKPKPFVFNCNETGLWDIYYPEIEDRCHSLPSTNFHWPFKNTFCKMCNEKSSFNFKTYRDISTCIEPPIDPGPGKPPFLRNLFSLQDFDFNPSNYGSFPCTTSQVYDEVQGFCRNVECFPGLILRNNTCKPLLPFVKYLRYVISTGIDVQFKGSIHLPIQFIERTRDQILLHISSVLSKEPVVDLLIMKTDSPCWLSPWEGPLHILLFIKITIPAIAERLKIESALINLKSSKFNFTQFMSSNETQDANHVVYLTFTRDDKSLFLPIEYNLNQRVDDSCFFVKSKSSDETEEIYLVVSQLLQCPQVELTKEEYTTTQERLRIYLKDYDISLDLNDFYITDKNNVRICLDKFLEIKAKQTTYSLLQILLMTSTSISLVCLLITFVTYCLFSYLRTVAGINNMILVFAMFFSFAFMEFGMDKTKHWHLCVFLASMIHYFWLATYFSFTVCSFHMFTTFYKTRIRPSESPSKKLKRTGLTLLYSFGIPLVIVMLNLLITKTIRVTSYGYGGKICFISEKISLIVTFITPVFIACAANVTLFILSAYSISQTPKIKRNATTRRNTVRLSVYVKLFVLSGGSWILQILDSFMPLTSLSYIVSFLNSLQGMYVFVGFICNKGVYKNYRKLFHCQKSKAETNSQPKTQSTNL